MNYKAKGCKMRKSKLREEEEEDVVKPSKHRAG